MCHQFNRNSLIINIHAPSSLFVCINKGRNFCLIAYNLVIKPYPHKSILDNLDFASSQNITFTLNPVTFYLENEILKSLQKHVLNALIDSIRVTKQASKYSLKSWSPPGSCPEILRSPQANFGARLIREAS